MQQTTRQMLAAIPRLRRYARALTHDADTADELVQDCLERAWGRLGLWRRGTDMRAWLFTILHNTHVNRTRQTASRPRPVPLDTVDPALVSVRPGQESNLEVQGIVMALDRLPADQRQVVLLVGLEGMSYQEAAKVLGIPLGTVMSRLSRGRERLRLIMRGEDARIGKVT